MPNFTTDSQTGIPLATVTPTGEAGQALETRASIQNTHQKATTNVHGATSTNTAGRIVARGASGEIAVGSVAVIGNVGIGTSSPGVSLDILGASNAYTRLTRAATANDGCAIFRTVGGPSAGNWQWQFGVAAGDTGFSVKRWDGTTVGNDLNISTTGNATFGGSVTATSFAGQGIVPVGGVTAWLKSYTNTPALPTGWVEANGQVLSDSGSVYNGQTLPDLNGSGGTKRFLRGSTTSGTTGGSETHTHTLCATASSVCSGSGICAVTAASVVATSTLPSYYEVVYIVRIK